MGVPLLQLESPCSVSTRTSQFTVSWRSVGNAGTPQLFPSSYLVSSSNFLFFPLSALQDCDNLADGSERDAPWSCGGGGGSGRRPLTSIIEHLRTSKSRLHNGESDSMYRCFTRVLRCPATTVLMRCHVDRLMRNTGYVNLLADPIFK